MTFSITSFNYVNMQPEHVQANLDRDLKTIYSATATIDATAIKAPAFGAGFAVMAGTIDVINGVTTVATGLTKVTQVVVTLNAGNGVPLNIWPTAQPNPTIAGSIDIFLFTPTSSGNNTPVQVTGANFVVHWIAAGTATTTTSPTS